MTDSQLIKLLEEEALATLTDINIPAESEDKITLEIVQSWYIETEKLIRVFSNLLPEQASQSINQLRYAGHHILKAITAQKPTEKQANLVESYKHCKRAYYDVIDFYVFHINANYQKRIELYADDNNISALLEKLEEHANLILNARLEASSRIDYYETIQGNLVNGLKIIKEINVLLARSDGFKKTLIDAKTILIENNDLHNENNGLQNEVAQLRKKLDNRYGNLGTWLTVIVVVATFFGLIFQGVGTDWVKQKFFSTAILPNSSPSK